MADRNYYDILGVGRGIGEEDIRKAFRKKAKEFELPMNRIVERLQTNDLQPSGIAIHPTTGSILIIASRQRALIELDREGNFVDATRMQLAKRHRQPEGIAISGTGKLFIADEGGRARARLTVYESISSSIKN